VVELKFDTGKHRSRVDSEWQDSWTLSLEPHAVSGSMTIGLPGIRSVARAPPSAEPRAGRATRNRGCRRRRHGRQCANRVL